MAFVVSSITDYVKANENQLLGKAVIGGKTASLLNLQTGVKGSAYLNLLTADPTIQAGGCSWDAAGTTTVTRRKIETGQMRINTTFCDKDLYTTSMQYGVRVAAGQKSLPFEEEFVAQNVAGVQKKVEEILWRGDSEGTTSTHLDLADGFIKIIGAASGVVDATVSGKTLAANTLDVIDAIVAGIPNEIIDRNDLVVFVGIEIYRKAVKAWQDSNLYHFVPANLEGSLETIIPGTNIKLVGVHGLTSQNKAYASYAENMYLGTDMAGDYEKFMFWYSEDNSEYRLKIEFNLGVQVAFPDFVVKYTA
jgi:hypothetical protein